MIRTTELGALRAFVAVARLSSFSRAARHLGVSPSAVSQAVRGIEGRVGTSLLHRTTRSVSPTDAEPRCWASWRRPLTASTTPSTGRAARDADRPGPC